MPRNHSKSAKFPSTSTNVYVVITPGVLLLDLAGIAEPLRLANRISSQQSGRSVPVFALHIVSAGAEVDSSLGVSLAGVGTLPPSFSSSSNAPDWVVIVGVASDPPVKHAQQISAQQITVRWLREVVKPALDARHVKLWTVCSGALLAARAGLLDGKRCTTHHELIDTLRALHPDLDVLQDRIFVQDDNVATSAGITAGIDLALAAISQH
jgi:transcriptional regulator GlxA family with amidase domain